MNEIATAQVRALTALSGPQVWYGREHGEADRLDLSADAGRNRRAGSRCRRARSDRHRYCRDRTQHLKVPGLRPLIETSAPPCFIGQAFFWSAACRSQRWSVRQCAIAYFGLGTLLGEPVSQNAMGHILGHVKDIGADYARPTHRGYQTAARLAYHCDSSDIVGLLCLKPAKAGGKSSIVSSWTLFNEMLRRHPDLLAELLQPVYRDRRGEVPDGAEPWYAVPVFNPTRTAGWSQLMCGAQCKRRSVSRSASPDARTRRRV